MEVTIPVKKNKIIKGKLKILNFKLNLTDLEIEIVSTMLEYKLYILDKINKNKLISLLGKDRFTVTNHISRLKAKGIISKTKHGLILNQNLIDLFDNSMVMIFKLNPVD